MEAARFAQPHILSQPVYQPGKPISQVAREFGLDPNKIDKLASNENPLGPSPKAVEAAAAALREVNLYPDGSCWDLTGKVAARLWGATSLFSAMAPMRCWSWWRMSFSDPAARRSWACMDLPSTSWSRC